MILRRFFQGAALCLLVTATVAFAATQENKYEEGKCSNGKTWWSVSTYEDGKLLSVIGRDCEGNIYIKNCDYLVVPNDPTNGVPPTFTGTGSNGVIWTAVVRYDAYGRVNWEGGRNANGQYWEATISHETTGGSGPGVE